MGWNIFFVDYAAQTAALSVFARQSQTVSSSVFRSNAEKNVSRTGNKQTKESYHPQQVLDTLHCVPHSN